MRRVLCTFLATVGAMAFAVAPSPAADTTLTFYSTSSAYTDLREPWKSFPATTDAPVGAWKDDHGRTHSSKAYYTFDLTPYRGAKFLYAHAWAPETAVTDCTKPLSTELWLTENADKPTWAKQPEELVPGTTGTTSVCPSNRVEFDVTKVLNDAVATGKTKVTLALRMAGRKQLDPAYGRRYGNALAVTTRINRPPHTPTDLRIDGTPCQAEPLPVSGVGSLGAIITDPDGYSGLAGRIELWNENAPAERLVREAEGDRVNLPVPADFLRDGQTYSWTATAIDGDVRSAPSKPCRFTTDLTAPATRPKVTSELYPENSEAPGTGGADVPGEFVLDASGDRDITTFRWSTSFSSGNAVADQPGGVARVMIKPGSEGPDQSVSVCGQDRVGNRGPCTSYRFYVAHTSPLVEPLSVRPLLGSTLEYRITPRMTNVAGYTYRYNFGPSQTVAANPDGTATIRVTVNSATSALDVWSTTREGYRSTSGYAQIPNADSAPTVTRDGEVFTFTPNLVGATRYEYSLDGGSVQTVAAREDGTAVVTIPHGPGSHSVEVQTFGVPGVESEYGSLSWTRD